MFSADLNISRSDRGRAIIPVIFFLSPLVASAVPRLTWLFLPLIATALIVTVMRRWGEWRQLIHPNTALVAVLLVVLYVCFNATWAADRGVAFGKAALLLGVLLITFAASRAIAQFDKQQVGSAAIAFTAGAFLGALFVLFELLTHGAITRMAMNSIPLIKTTSAKRVVMSQGQILDINLSDLNQNVAIVMLNLWPGLLLLRTIEGGTRRAILVGIFFLAVAVPVLVSEHQSSQLALIGSLLIFSIAWMWRRQAIRALAVLWCMAFVFVLPLSFFAYKTELHMASWLPNSARARVIIWEYTAERVLDRPWLGIGADSTRALKQQREAAEQPEGFIFQRTTAWHAHDLFLQTWYELGVVGVILIALAGAAVALRMSLLPAEAQPFAAETFVSFWAIAAFGWGMWQTWLMCAVGLMLVYLGIAARASGGSPEH